MSKVVGVVGGMGPAATVDFMSKVIAMTPAVTEQDHIRMLVDNNPAIPSRQSALRGDGEDPGPALAAIASGLERAGAEMLVMPCNTAHAWADDIRNAVNIPLVSIIDETVAACDEYGTIGLLSTPGCVQSNVYQQGFGMRGKQVVLPTADELAEIMDLVFRIKAGDRSDALGKSMASLANALAGRGADVIVVACTEIPLVLQASDIVTPVVDSTDVLAAATIRKSGA